jgi:hypothetical protein
MHTTSRSICSVLLCALAIPAAPPAVGSQDIFKCVDGNATAYQSVPCANGQAETRMTTGAPPSRAEVQVAALPALAARQPLRTVAGPWRRTTLTLGMSDDEVLNLPGWGRPTKITRTKMSRTWREE